MTIPGFTAEESLNTARRQYHPARSRQRTGRVQPAARMTPQQCYKRDSNCTKFCGQVKDPAWRYECFSRCNIYLDNCLGVGVWTDRAATRG